jgi:L-fuconolactonase
MRHMLQDEASPQDVLASPVFRRNVAVLQARGLVYEILIRSGQFAGVAEFCASLDRHILVLDHLGKPPVRDRSAAAFASWRAALHEVAALPHVLCKLSGLLTEAKPGDSLAPDDFHRYFDAVLECFGPRRLIFGSDWPVCLLARPYCETASLAEEWSRRLSPKEYDAFWGGNAQSCYAII